MQVGLAANFTVMYPIRPFAESAAGFCDAVDEGSGLCTDRTCGRCWSEETAWSTWFCTELSGAFESLRTTCAPVPPEAGACCASTWAPWYDWVPGSEKSSE